MSVGFSKKAGARGTFQSPDACRTRANNTVVLNVAEPRTEIFACLPTAGRQPQARAGQDWSVPISQLKTNKQPEPWSVLHQCSCRFAPLFLQPALSVPRGKWTLSPLRCRSFSFPEPGSCPSAPAPDPPTSGQPRPHTRRTSPLALSSSRLTRPRSQPLASLRPPHFSVAPLSSNPPPSILVLSTAARAVHAPSQR